MNLITRSSLSTAEKLEILELWNNEYPKILNYKSKEGFDEYLENLDEQSHLLLIDEKKKVRGWYFDFDRENEKWFAILLDSKIQEKGLGTKILNLAKEKESKLNGWVIDHNNSKKGNGEIYKSPLMFYLKNGFEKIPQVRLELDKISAVKIKWVR